MDKIYPSVKHACYLIEETVLLHQRPDMKMDYGGIRLEVREDRLALVTMCNGDNKFTMDYLKTWHQVLDDIEK